MAGIPGMALVNLSKRHAASSSRCSTTTSPPGWCARTSSTGRCSCSGRSRRSTPAPPWSCGAPTTTRACRRPRARSTSSARAAGRRSTASASRTPSRSSSPAACGASTGSASPSCPRRSYDRQIRLMNDLFRSEAEKHPGVQYIDAYAVFSDGRRLLAVPARTSNGETQQVREADGEHLTYAGGMRLAKAVMAAIKAEWLTKQEERPQAPASASPSPKASAERPRRRPDAAGRAGGRVRVPPAGRCSSIPGMLFPTITFAVFFLRRLRGELAAHAAPPPVEVVHHRGQLRVLRLVGLALRPAARGRHVREPGARRADRARARAAAAARAAKALARARRWSPTSRRSATSSTSTSSPSTSTTCSAASASARRCRCCASLLPVGISFLVFRVLTYTIDIYRGAAGAGLARWTSASTWPSSRTCSRAPSRAPATSCRSCARRATRAASTPGAPSSSSSAASPRRC